uniref:Uncharacterized protein n=1 Tax=Romanomermis culicivorax TaxID=13658 RepID=A0A915I002_ROMCU
MAQMVSQPPKTPGTTIWMQPTTKNSSSSFVAVGVVFTKSDSKLLNTIIRINIKMVRLNRFKQHKWCKVGVFANARRSSKFLFAAFMTPRRISPLLFVAGSR